MENKSNFIFGLHPVMEAIKAHKDLDKILLQRDAKGPQIGTLRKLIKEHRIPVQHVPPQKLNAISRKNHQGVIAFLSPVGFQPLAEVVTGVFESGEVPLVLVLDRVSDVRNFGAICRTAICSGVHAVLIPVKGSAQVNAEAIKSSSGALLKIPLCRERNLAQEISMLKDYGFQVIACTEKTDEYPYSIDFSLPTAIIMGSEEDGISSPLMKLADRKAKIPMKGDIGSLNVSVSAGVILYEVVRQRL